jgi:hypothetical protein
LAGQSVGLVDEIKPVKRIIDEMVNDSEAELQRLHSIFNGTKTLQDRNSLFRR